jgi:hypothetical protein
MNWYPSQRTQCRRNIFFGPIVTAFAFYQAATGRVLLNSRHVPAIWVPLAKGLPMLGLETLLGLGMLSYGIWKLRTNNFSDEA